MGKVISLKSVDLLRNIQLGIVVQKVGETIKVDLSRRLGQYTSTSRVLKTVDDICFLCEYLREPADRIIQGYDPDGISPESIMTFFCSPAEGLAARGHAALNIIFGDLIGLVELGDLDHPLITEIVSDDFWLPWELLYDAPLRETPPSDLRDLLSPFWGVSRVVSRRRFEDTGGIQDNGLHSPIRVGLVWDQSLVFAQRERDWLFEEHAAGRIILTEFRPDDETSAGTFIFKLNSFISNPDIDVLHFACHFVAESSGKSPESNPLKMALRIDRNEYKLAYAFHEPVVKPSSRLIFLNVCRTGVVNPRHSFHFARIFWDQGARHIIAAEALMDSEISESYSRRFYKHFLGGDSLGIASYRARQDLLGGNISLANIGVVFYSIYGGAELRVAVLK